MPLALMSLNTKLIIQFIILVSLFALNPNERVLSSLSHGQQKSRIQMPKSGALLASRINSLKELNEIIQFDYFPLDSNDHAAVKKVTLRYPHQNDTIVAVLEEGIAQGMIVAARDGGLWDKLSIVIKEPFAVKNRNELRLINILARRFRNNFGDEDLAFYDLAQASVRNILYSPSAYLMERDSSEKGYINTFNHITAQALISSIFGVETANFVAVVHERENMPKLFDEHYIYSLQAKDDINKAVDNYVDLINNRFGQLIGKELSFRYNIDRNTRWTNELLANYLNDIQEFYRRSFNIGMRPFDPKELLVQRFVRKLNMILS